MGLLIAPGKAGAADPGAGCGGNVRAKDVLVLDLESFRGRPEAAQEYADERAGNFRLLKADIREIRTPVPPARDPQSLVRSARRLGVKSGCDLVLVLKTGPYFGRQRNMNARIRDRGYAFVALGQRTVGGRR